MSKLTADDAAVRGVELGPPRGRLTVARFENVVVVALCVAALIGVLIATRNGPGVTFDSIYYLNIGLNIADGLGVAHSLGLTPPATLPVTLWPPGLPIVVAVGEAMGLDPYLTIRIFNSAAMIAAVLLSYVLLRRHVTSPAVALGGTAFVATSPWLLANFSYLLSEPAFIPLCLAFILVMEDLIRKPKSNGFLIIAAVLVWFAFMLRYQGIALIPIGIITILIGLWHTDRNLAAKRALIFAAGALIVPAAWMLRNVSVSGKPLGNRSPSQETPFGSAYDLLTTLGHWFIDYPHAVVRNLTGTGNPSRFSDNLLAVSGGILLLVLGGLAFWRLHQNRQSPDTSSEISRTSLVPLISFTLGMTVYTWASALSTVLDPVGNRLLSPIYIPLLVLVAITLDRFLRNSGRNTRIAIGAAFAICLALQITSFVKLASVYSAGTGYLQPASRNSGLMAQISELPEDAVIYTGPGAGREQGIWLHTRRVALNARTNPFNVNSPYVSQIADGAACGKTYLVWFGDAEPTGLDKAISLTPTSKFADGTLYRLAAKTAAGRPC